MEHAEREQLEREIAAYCAESQYAAATTIAIKGYGPEILGYLMAATGREQDAADIFSDYCEKLWRALPGFRGESSFRTWSYRVAHNALAQAARTGARRGRRVVAMAELPEVEALIDHVRTQTLPYLRTQVKEEVTRLRDQLEDEDRTLLILRIDRRLPWDEIAHIIEPELPTPESVKRLSASLRKRFQRLKLQLRELTKGLITEQ